MKAFQGLLNMVQFRLLDSAILLPVNRLLARRKYMPHFLDTRWKGYTIQVRPNDKLRRLIRKLFFHTDLLPYLYGSYILFDLIVIPPKCSTIIEEKLEIIWRILFDDGTILEENHLEVKIHGNKKQTLKIETGLIDKPAQYKFALKVVKDGEDKNSEKWNTMVLFTIKDRDEFYAQSLYLLIGAIVGGIIAIIAFWIQKFFESHI
jgi:hypothetical protein